MSNQYDIEPISFSTDLKHLHAPYTLSHAHVCVLQDPKPPVIRRLNYERANLQRAYAATREGMSVHRAAHVYRVPESTLRDRTRGNVEVDARNGTGTLLPQSHEKELVAHIKYMSDIGYGYNKSDVQYMARDFAISLGIPVKCETHMSSCWFYDFLKRWPELKVAKPQKLGFARAKATSSENLAKYYNELDNILTVNNLLGHPENIYNIDETGVNTEHTPSKIVCGKYSTAQSVTSPRSSNVTIIASGNALGNHVPPYYVFPGKRWNSDLLQGAPTGSGGEMSSNGWSNSEVFTHYLTTHFATYAGLRTQEDGHKTLILYDGHRSHVLLTLTEWAKEHNVILFVLPPHSSHLTQPLDVGVFGPFKRMLHAECQTYMRQHPGISITKHDIAKLTATPYTRALSTENLVSAFRKTGVFPLNKHAITAEQVAPATIYPSAAGEASECDDTAPVIHEMPVIHTYQSVTVPLSTSGQAGRPHDTTTTNSDPEPTTPTVRPVTVPPPTSGGSSKLHDIPATYLHIQLATPTDQTVPRLTSSFIENRTIKSVVVKKPKRKFIPPFIAGNLLSQNNQNVLKASAAKKINVLKSHDKGNRACINVSSSSVPSTSRGKENVEPTPGVSGTARNTHDDMLVLAPDSDGDDTDDDIAVTDSELCCVCHDWQPELFRTCKTLNFVSWGQCDFCGHWTHLKYCSNVSVLRRASVFRCPHCLDK